MNAIPTPKEDPISPPKSNTRRNQLLTVVGLLLVAGGCYFVYDAYFFVSTDNAMVQAQTTLLSARVGGLIVKAEVKENQKVKKGDVLVEIKAEDYQAMVDLSSSDHGSLADQVHGAEINYRRTLDLLHKGASTQERLDAVETQYRSLKNKLKASEALMTTASLNLGYTKITAPADGVIGRKSFEVGMLASPGQPLLGFVEGNERWVVANLKETDMDHIVPGNKAKVSVDAISGREFEGEVESISPTTGATFSLLPPDNATGNFTKVVQRVPVRIKLLNLSEKDIDRLQSGLSAEVKIRVH